MAGLLAAKHVLSIKILHTTPAQRKTQKFRRHVRIYLQEQS